MFIKFIWITKYIRNFALFANIKQAEEMMLKLKKRFSSCKNLEFIICSGKNTGADIQLV